MQYIVLKSVKSAVNICANIIVMCTSVRQNAVALFMSMLCFLDESLRSCYGRNLLLCCRHSVTVVQFVWFCTWKHGNNSTNIITM